jgi:hypothetical protein
MKTKQPASSKKQPVTLKDLTTKKNPKGGASVNTSLSNKRPCGSGTLPAPVGRYTGATIAALTL